MEKWLNSLLYGNEQTKSYIIAIIVLSALTITFGVLCVLNLSFGFGFLCVAAGVLDGIILQNITFEDETVLLKRKLADEQEKERKNSKEQSVNEEEKSLEGEPDLGEDGLSLEGSKKKKHKKIVEGELEDILVDTEEKEEEDGPYKNYTKEKVEVMLYKYKVKEEHRRVMVDFCAPFRIRQCPAYVWRDKKNLYFLLLEEEPRKIEIPLSTIDGIHYERGAVAKSALEYDGFKEHSFVGSVFLSYLPTYYEKTKNDRRVNCKNLYVINPDLKVTNTSARNLFDILEMDFILEDAIMTSGKFDSYFKMAYKSNVLLRDRVITAEEYKNKIRILLTSISQGEMSGKSYIELINQLEEYKLITEEYAKYYREEGLVKNR